MKSTAVKLFCLYCFSLVLVGCGGGSSGPVEPTNPAPPPADLKAANGGGGKNMATLPD